MDDRSDVMEGKATTTVFDAREGSSAVLALPANSHSHSHCEQRALELDGRRALQLSLRHSDGDPQRMQAHVWLPPVSVAAPQSIGLELYGSGSGARLSVDCLDNGRWGLRYYLGLDEKEGWQRMSVASSNVLRRFEACDSSYEPQGPLTPVALHIEDSAHQRNISLALGNLTVEGQRAGPIPPGGTVSSSLAASGLKINAAQGIRRLLSEMKLYGMLGGSGHPLVVGNARQTGPGEYSAELMNGGPLAEIALSAEQSTSMLWEYRFTLKFLRDADIEWLKLGGELPLLDLLGASVCIEEDDSELLSGSARPEGVILEPAVWEAINIGGTGIGPLTIRFDGDPVKTVRLCDLRIEQERPFYSAEALIAERESFSAGSTLSFGVQLSTGRSRVC